MRAEAPAFGSVHCLSTAILKNRNSPMLFRSRPSQAFTLIELIATIAVLAAVTTAGLILFGG
jgi:prepilin-type N-terminal cleavage/methylation domain-containing protein